MKFDSQSGHIEWDMSKRFYTALAITQGLMANPKLFDGMGEFMSESIMTLVVVRSYEYADELLKQEKNGN